MTVTSWRRLAAIAAVFGIACSAPDISLPRVSGAEPTGGAGRPRSAAAHDAPMPLILPLPMVAEPPAQRPKRPRPILVGQINLNTADANELVLLPGIGETKAARIIAWRSHRPFGRIKDLRRVKGFGRKTLLRLERFLIIAGPTTLRYEWPEQASLP